MAQPSNFTIRYNLHPGDVGAIVHLHGVVYAREYGFDPTFEAYVAGPLAEFVLHPSERSRLWIAERRGQIVGSIAIVEASISSAQLRWYLVEPAARGHGLGKSLIDLAVAFARDCAYESVYLWTVSALTAAARLYRDAGFVKVEEKPGRHWGVDDVEERYVLDLKTPA